MYKAIIQKILRQKIVSLRGFQNVITSQERKKVVKENKLGLPICNALEIIVKLKLIKITNANYSFIIVFDPNLILIF